VAEKRYFLFVMASSVHKTSYPVINESSFQRGERSGNEADHAPPCSVDVKNAWSHTSAPPYVFMMWCFIKHIIHLYNQLSTGRSLNYYNKKTSHYTVDINSVQIKLKTHMIRNKSMHIIRTINIGRDI
jgi:hypothetical protein